jgi:hypothetical protein
MHCVFRTIASKPIVASGVFQLWCEVRLSALRFAGYDHNNNGGTHPKTVTTKYNPASSYLGQSRMRNRRLYSCIYLELVYFLCTQ